MKNIKITIIFILLSVTHSIPGFAAGQNDIFGVWGSVTLQGDLKPLSPDLEKIKWLVMNQTRTRDDSSNGSRFTENLLFSQVGYQINGNASFWVGYVHNWISPLNKTSFQESRPYQDFIWKQDISSFTVMSRTRMEQRIHETTGDTGYRARQFLQINHPLPLIDGLSAYVGEEVFFYMNQNNFGKKGFSENRVFSGLSYQATKKMGVDLGYMGQYVDTISGRNIFTHNVQVNFRYKFN
jgi:hypothetical protein